MWGERKREREEEEEREGRSEWGDLSVNQRLRVPGRLHRLHTPEDQFEGEPDLEDWGGGVTGLRTSECLGDGIHADWRIGEDTATADNPMDLPAGQRPTTVSDEAVPGPCSLGPWP